MLAYSKRLATEAIIQSKRPLNAALPCGYNASMIEDHPARANHVCWLTLEQRIKELPVQLNALAARTCAILQETLHDTDPEPRKFVRQSCATWRMLRTKCTASRPCGAIEDALVRLRYVDDAFAAADVQAALDWPLRQFADEISQIEAYLKLVPEGIWYPVPDSIQARLRIRMQPMMA